MAAPQRPDRRRVRRHLRHQRGPTARWRSRHVAATAEDRSADDAPLNPDPATAAVPAANPARTPIVLVHGGWHGGWCWRKVVPLLRAAGHEVWTPTLTGLGDRGHLLTPAVDLSTHVQDVVNLLEYEDLRGVLLVGHSSGGTVVAGVAQRVPERLAHLAYLDAFVPEAGQSLVDLLSPERRHDFERRVRAEGEDWKLPSPAPGPWEVSVRQVWGVADEADLRWMVPRLGPHPFKTMTEPLPAGNPAATPPRTYIRCTSFPNPTFDRFAEAAGRPGSGWRSRELATGHDAMVTMPRALAALLLGSAAADGPAESFASAGVACFPVMTCPSRVVAAVVASRARRRGWRLARRRGPH